MASKPQARKPQGHSRRWLSTWTDELAIDFAFYLLVAPLITVFILIWSATQNLLIAILATPVVIYVLAIAGSRFIEWWRSI